MSLEKGPLRGLTLEKIGGQIYCSAMIPTWTPYTSSVWCLLRRAHSEAWPWRKLVVRSTAVLWYLPELHIHLLFDVSCLLRRDTYLNSIYIFRLMSLEKGPLRGLTLEKIGGQIYCLLRRAHSEAWPWRRLVVRSTVVLWYLPGLHMMSLQKGPLRGLTLEKIGGQIYCSAMIPTWTPYTSSDWCLLRRAHSEAWPWRRLVVRSTAMIPTWTPYTSSVWCPWEGPTQRPDLGEDW